MSIYKLEILPRYGTKMGIIWRQDDAIGHIRIPNEVESLLWEEMIVELNKKVEEKIANSELELENEMN